MPNIGLAPAITDLGAATSNLATQLSFSFNLALENALSNIEQALPVTISRFDVFSLVSSIVAAPHAYGINNAADACLTPEVTKAAICKKPDNYLFWDGIHPTRKGHDIFAEAALEALP